MRAIALVAAATAAPCATAGLDIAAVVARIDAEHLDREPAWHALVEYRRAFVTSRLRSEADRADFFLAPGGADDPRAELIATATAVLGDGPEAVRARCRFPARDRWLRTRLALGAPSAPSECPALDAWLASLRARTMTIDFASSYLESPSSMFGHTFLRFAPDGAPALLAPTVNYAADTAQRDGAVGFVLKGLFGGFPGKADELPAFRRLRRYADDEGRDIWSYPLRLEPDQVEMLLLHLWEVHDGTFDYFFLDENCSYRTLMLIAAARPSDALADRLPISVVPVETLKALDDHGLLGAPTWWPSSPRLLLWRTRDFAEADLHLVADLARGRVAPATLAQTDPQRRAAILGAAADYAAILINRNQVPLGDRTRIVHGLIDERLRLETGRPADPPPEPVAPHRQHDPQRAALAYVRRDGRSGLDVELAGFAHSIVDPMPGFDEGAEVVVLSGRARRLDEGPTKVEQIDLLRVRANTPTSLLFPRMAWSLHVGAERKLVDDERPLLASAGFAAGKAIGLGGAVLAVRAGADLDGGEGLHRGAGLEASGTIDLTRQARGIALQAWYQRAAYAWGDDSDREVYGVAAGIPLARHLGLTLEWRRERAEAREDELRLELRAFFGG
ncbi:MAG TPA: DUF4105 domain-containing protein [Nevskiaceae bacterium]|nr:DUF4105 domain-containing protein [Nevskiaceae bacterium]